MMKKLILLLFTIYFLGFVNIATLAQVQPATIEWRATTPITCNPQLRTKFLIINYVEGALLQCSGGTYVPIGGGGADIGQATVIVSSLATGGTGTYADPWTGWDAALTTLMDANGANHTYYFPSGVYGYSTSPNFGKYGNVYFRGELGTVLKYTGSGDAVDFDGSTQPAQQAAANTVFGIIFENFVIDGTGTGTVGLYLRSIHHSTFRNVFVRNVTEKKFYFRFTILNVYDTLHATSRVGDVDGLGEETTNAVNGFYLTNDGDSINAVQACTFINPIVELVTGDGAVFQGANQNTISGGSFEQNGGTNVKVYGNGNTFYGTDNEYSGVNVDWYIGGNDNKLLNALGTGYVKIGNDIDGNTTVGNTISGGKFGGIYIDINATNTKIEQPTYNFVAVGGFVNHSPTTTIVGAPINGLTNAQDTVSLVTPTYGFFKDDVQFSALKGVVLQAPDGTLHRLKVANDGAVSSEVATIDVGQAASDNFNDNSFGRQWSTDSMVTSTASSLVTLAETSSAFNITLPNSTAGLQFAGKSNGGHTIADDGVEQIHLVSRPSSGPYQMRFGIGRSANNCLMIFVDGGTIFFFTVSGGSGGTIASTTFNATNHAYWRFRRSGVDIIAELDDNSSFTSPVTLGTAQGALGQVPFSFSKFRTVIEAGSTGSSTFDAPVVYDDYIITP